MCGSDQYLYLYSFETDRPSVASVSFVQVEFQIDQTFFNVTIWITCLKYGFEKCNWVIYAHSFFVDDYYY